MAPTTGLAPRPWVIGLAVALVSSACAGRHPTRTPVPAPAPAPAPSPPPAPVPSAPASRAALSTQEGYATYVAHAFHGRTSASGEPFDERALVAAHRTLPFGSVVRVTNVKNGRSVTVRIVDRGPYGQNYREGTIIDVSLAAARRLRMIDDGQVPARVEVLKLAEAK